MRGFLRPDIVGTAAACGPSGNTGIMSFIILKVVDATIGLRVTEDDETEGLDIVLHDERGYNL